MITQELRDIIHGILEKKGTSRDVELTLTTSLRKDLGLDSFDLAELTVLLEDEFSVDIFADGLVDTIEEVENKLHGHG